jgi:hypothetical protein
MISIEQLKQTLCNTKFKTINLPNDISQYCQVGYTVLRAHKDRYKEELEQQKAIKTAVEAGIEVNVIKSDNINGFDNLVKKEDKRNYRIANVKYSSYLNYTENSTFDLPEDLIELLGNQMNKTVKLYGLKNPNSFIKSIILLNEPNYMVFNKYQMNQAVFKWRTDLAYQYKNNQKLYSKMPRNDLHNLETMLLRENFHNSMVAQLAVSYTGKNIIILDYINKKYEIYITELEINEEITKYCYHKEKDFYLIIKYQDCYLPCLKVNNNNLFKFPENYKKLELINYKYHKTTISKSIISTNKEEDLSNDKLNVKMLSSVIDMSKLKRDDMQRIAIAYDIDIMKPGSKPGSKIKKLKQDLYNDFKTVLYNESKMSVNDF